MGRRVLLGVLVLACCLAAGCASESMKGTPFYTGSYGASQGAPQDRVNLWPLLYYRRPALSVLWPIGEYVAGQHVAVRPLFSVYGLRKPQPEVNVLWPLGHFAPGKNTYRIFPAFWGRSLGKPYFVFFPLVWYSKGDHAGVFPFFLRYTEGAARSTHVLWPIFNVKAGWGERGWRLWPFYGQYRKEGYSRRYAMWPLGMSIHDGDEHTRWLAPFYFGHRSPEERWDLVFPVYYAGKQADGRRTVLTPLYMTSRQGNSWWRVVPPLYYARRSGDVKSDLLFPFAYRWADGQSRMLLTLPYGFKQSGQTRTIFAFPLLSAYSRSPEGKDFWGLYPLSHWRWDADGVQESHVFPFYYRRRSDGLFISLPYSTRRQEGRGFVNVLGPIYHKWWVGTAHSTSVLWPLIGTTSGPDASGNYMRLLYSYSRKGDTKRLQLGPSIGEASLIGRKWSGRGHSWWLFPVFGGHETHAVADKEDLSVRRRHFIVFPLVWHSSSQPVDGSGRKVTAPRPASRTETMVLPLWRSWRRGLDGGQQKTGEKGFWLLGWLYDSKKSVSERKDGSGLDTYVRRRVLWRLMHYERQNDQVSLDVLPGITYDNEPGERKTFSLLWRVFRYDWSKEKGTKVHVLFIPFGG